MNRPSSTLRKIALSLILFSSAPFPLMAKDQEIKGLKFSQKELQLLKDIDRIESGAGMAATMLKVSPFVMLFGSPSPVDVAITVTTNDWDKIGGSLSNLQKIASCKIVETIDYWIDVDGNSYSNPNSKLFFETMRSKANKGC
jgi:hypothetical protein